MADFFNKIVYTDSTGEEITLDQSTSVETVDESTLGVANAEEAQHAVNADNAANAANVTTNINGKAISSIFESDGVTVKRATDVTSTINGVNVDEIFMTDGKMVRRAASSASADSAGYSTRAAQLISKTVSNGQATVGGSVTLSEEVNFDKDDVSFIFGISRSSAYLGDMVTRATSVFTTSGDLLDIGAYGCVVNDGSLNPHHYEVMFRYRPSTKSLTFRGVNVWTLYDTGFHKVTNETLTLLLAQVKKAVAE